MTYLYEELKSPTRLYIKQCSHCELKYFGKSTSKDIENYPGSGKKWKNHLQKHNAKSNHLWHSDWYHDNSISKFALRFSLMNKIVESNKWANLTEENGLDGGDLSLFVDYDKVSSTQKGKSLSKETIEKRQKSRKLGAGWGQNKGKKWSDEWRENALRGMKEKGFDYNRDPEITAKKVSTRMKNDSYKKTEEEKKLMSERMTAVWEERKKNGYKVSDETKRKISKTLKAKKVERKDEQE
jgi:hypothetical protein